MLKRVAACGMALAILLGAMPVLGEENTTIQKMEKTAVETIELSLEGAIAMAKTENLRLKAEEAAIKSAELSLEVTEDKQKDFKKMEKYVAVNISDGLDMAYLKHGYYLDAAKEGLSLAKMSKTQVEAAVQYEVIEKYYNVKLVEKLMEITETGVKIARENEEIMKERYAVGFVSLLDVKSAENATRKAENALESYKRSADIAERSFKVSLGIEDSECKLNLTDEIVIPEENGNYSEAITNALATRYDMTAVGVDFKLKSEKFEIAEKYLSENMALYHSVYSEYMKSKYSFENAQKMMRIGLEAEYAAILDAKENMLSSSSDLQLAEENYESAKVQYDLGLITNFELTYAQSDRDNKHVSLENAKTAYALALIKFNYSTTIGI